MLERNECVLVSVDDIVIRGRAEEEERLVGASSEVLSRLGGAVNSTKWLPLQKIRILEGMRSISKSYRSAASIIPVSSTVVT